MSVDKTSLRTISQKEYLKRYLSKSKSKSKKKTSIKSNVKVIDDNDLTNHYVEENFDVETGEDAPVIAAIIDERPKLIKRLEEYKTSNRWAPVPEVNKGEEKSSVQNDHQSEQRLPSNEQNTSCHDLENHQKKRPHNSTSKKHETDDVSCSSSSSSDQFKSKRKKSRSSLAKNSEIKSDSLHHSEKKHSKTRDSSTMKTSRKCSPRRHSREQNRSDAKTSVKENKQENNSLRNERNSVLAGGKESENNKNEKKVTAEQYYQWGKGLKQIEDENEKLTSDLREMSKPLARYVDDADLEKRLRDVGREGDPFAAMKINKNGEDLSDDSKPKYKGAYPQNRFGIAPGHKWDGVDRSNGYEVKWLGKAKAKEAVEEEAYKWSTADM